MYGDDFDAGIDWCVGRGEFIEGGGFLGVEGLT